jgi:hypothetical protein
MNNRWRSEIEAKNDPLAQGSEARAAFCSAKRLEDVKTTGKMKNIDAGIVPGTCQQSSPDPSPASDRSIAASAEHHLAFLRVETRIADEGVCQSRHLTAAQKSADPGQTGRFQPLRSGSYQLTQKKEPADAGSFAL